RAASARRAAPLSTARLLGEPRQPRVLGREALAARERHLGRALHGHEPTRPRADEIRAPHAPEGLAEDRPVLRVVIAQEGLVEAPLLGALRRLDLFGVALHRAERVLSREVH